MTVRVLIADDQSIVWTGLTTILDAQHDIAVVGQAADGREAVTLARELCPDLCLFDVRMPYLEAYKPRGSSRVPASPTPSPSW